VNGAVRGSKVVGVGDGVLGGTKEVRVGEVVVKVREGKGTGGSGAVVGYQGEGEGVVRETGEVNVHVVEKNPPVIRKLVMKYRSNGEDLKWARSGVVASVVNREANPVVQKRVEYAGFADLEIIPMGADKEFLKSV